eukprot:gene8213-9776_t
MRCTASETVGVVTIYAHNLETFWYESSAAVPELSDILWLNSNLQELRLEELSDLSEEYFGGLSMPHLRLLSLWNTPCSDEMLDAGVIAVAQYCPQLRSLGLSALPISDEALLQVTQLCPCIISLDLSDNDVVTDLGVRAIAENLHDLRRLSISNGASLTDTSLAHLTKHNTSALQELRITGLPSVRVDVLAALLQECIHLHTLSLDCDLDAYSAEIVPHMRNLRKLITYFQISDDTLYLVAKHCKKLEELAIFSDRMYVAPSHVPHPAGGMDVNTHVMHHAANEILWEDRIYTEKGLLSLMDGLPLLRALVVNEKEIQHGLLTPLAQSVWRRLRPRIVFGYTYNYFIFNVLLE